jgi:hypothetical protein
VREADEQGRDRLVMVWSVPDPDAALTRSSAFRPTALRPVARWVREADEQGRDRLVMVWSVPDPDAALTGLAATTEA